MKLCGAGTVPGAWEEDRQAITQPADVHQGHTEVVGSEWGREMT